jgi:hypothetical protein
LSEILTIWAGLLVQEGGHLRRLRAIALGAGGVAVVAAAVGFGAPAGADTEFTFGTGFAQASMVVPALNSGELSVPVVLGESAAGYQDETGKASSSTFAIPLLAATSGVGGPVCGVEDGGGADIPLPEPLVADTASTQNKKPVNKASDNNSQGQAVQEVHAAPNSSGSSRTQFAAVGAPGILELGGVASETSAVADPKKQTRRVRASASAATVSLFGGMVKFTGMRWELVQTSDGADSRTTKRGETHAFSFDGITAAGVHIPIATPEAAAGAVNTANALLEPLGLTLELPRFEDNKKGRLQVTPFKVKIGGPNWVLSPIIGGVISQERFVNLQGQLFKFLLEPDCEQLLGLLKLIPDLNAQYNKYGGVVPLLFAALMGVPSGGSATLSIGGVTTALDDTYFPPLDFGGPAYVETPGLDEIPGEPALQSTTPRLHRVTGAATSTKTGRCHSTSPAGAGCWRGLAPLAAALAGVVAVGSLAADEISTRRRVARLARNEIQ